MYCAMFQGKPSIQQVVIHKPADDMIDLLVTFPPYKLSTLHGKCHQTITSGLHSKTASFNVHITQLSCVKHNMLPKDNRPLLRDSSKSSTILRKGNLSHRGWGRCCFTAPCHTCRIIFNVRSVFF